MQIQFQRLLRCFGVKLRLVVSACVSAYSSPICSLDELSNAPCTIKPFEFRLVLRSFRRYNSPHSDFSTLVATQPSRGSYFRLSVGPSRPFWRRCRHLGGNHPQISRRGHRGLRWGRCGGPSQPGCASGDTETASDVNRNLKSGPGYHCATSRIY